MPTLPPVTPPESLAGPRALVEMQVLLEALQVLAQPSCYPPSLKPPSPGAPGGQGLALRLSGLGLQTLSPLPAILPRPGSPAGGPLYLQAPPTRSSLGGPSLGVPSLGDSCNPSLRAVFETTPPRVSLTPPKTPPSQRCWPHFACEVTEA